MGLEWRIFWSGDAEGAGDLAVIANRLNAACKSALVESRTDVYYAMSASCGVKEVRYGIVRGLPIGPERGSESRQQEQSRGQDTFKVRYGY